MKRTTSALEKLEKSTGQEMGSPPPAEASTDAEKRMLMLRTRLVWAAAYSNHLPSELLRRQLLDESESPSCRAPCASGEALAAYLGRHCHATAGRNVAVSFVVAWRQRCPAGDRCSQSAAPKKRGPVWTANRRYLRPFPRTCKPQFVFRRLIVIVAGRQSGHRGGEVASYVSKTCANKNRTKVLLTI
jgi:hypothetical protein